VARILVVDDEPLNRSLLRACFAGSGHVIVEASRGEDALVAAEDDTPDLVLLDVMMPGMDGFEVTRQLKAMFVDTFVPVILVTALDDRESRVTGLVAGADEFLTKPIDRDELLTRAGNLLALRARDSELQRRNVELAELHRFQDETMAMLVHDLKSPLSVILASVDYLLAGKEIAGDAREALDDCRQAGSRIARLVANILETAHAESGRLVPRHQRVDVVKLFDDVIGPRRAMLERRGVALEIDAGALAVDVDRDLIARVVENLVENALRSTAVGGRLRLWATERDELVELRVGHTGPAIPAASRPLVFEKFTQVWDSRRGGIGLGLYFCRLAVEAHGGRIWIEEDTQLPTVFAFSLPNASLGRGDARVVG
jgi:two-component system, sensor histidine kinase and response regulator